MKRFLPINALVRLLLVTLGCLLAANLCAQQQIKVSTKDKTATGTLRGNADLSLIIQTTSDQKITSLLVTPDRRHLVTISDIPRVWDIATGCLLRELIGHKESILTAALSPDGQNLLTRDEQEVRIWKLLTGELVETKPYDPTIPQLSWFGPHRYVQTSRRWERWPAGQPQPDRVIEFPEEERDTWFCFALSPDGKTVAMGHYSGAISLWDLESGNRIRRILGHGRFITSLQFSADGKRLLSASRDRTIRLWNVTDGKEQLLLAGHFDDVAEARFREKDSQVVSLGRDGTLRTWNAETGEELSRQSIEFLKGRQSIAAWMGDHQLLVTDWDRCALVDLLARTVIQRFESKVEPASSILTSHTGKWLAVAGVENGTLRLWNLQEGTPAWSHELGLDRNQIQDLLNDWMSRPLLFSSDEMLLVHFLPYEARVYQTATGQLLRTLPIRTGSFSQARLLAGDKLAINDRTEALGIWNLVTGKAEEFTVPDHPAASTRCMAISADGSQAVFRGRRVAGTDNDEAFYVRNVADDKDVLRLDSEGYHLREIRFGDGGQIFGLLEERPQDKQVLMFERATGKIARRFPLPAAKASAEQAGFRPQLLSTQGGSLAVAVNDTEVVLFDVATGREVCTLRGHTSAVSGIEFLPGGRHAITSSRDQTCRVWQLPEGKDLGSIVSFTDGGWAVVDQEGRFDASAAGDVEGMQWVVDNEPIALKQLKHRYFEPKLLPKMLGFRREPIRDVGTFTRPDLYPHADLLGDDLSQLKLQLHNRGGGIGRVQIFVNGKELLADARGPQPEAEAKSATLSLDLSGASLMPGQANRVEVITWNKEGYLSSRGCIRNFPGPKELADPPRLFAVVAGISTYENDTLNLRFAAKDAEDFATALELGGKRLFGADQVHLHLLTTSGDPRARAPTKANFEQVFADLRQAGPGDVLVVYLAGHGVALQQGKDLYCYLTANARTLDPQEFSDTAVRAATTISSEELAEWIKQIPALKQVLILDTCAAGAAVVKLTEKRDISGDQIRAIERFKDRTGFHVLMGCSADRVSYEASQYAQGLLTYSLLQGMRGASLRDEQFVDISKLFQFAADRVPELAQNIGGVQRPVVAAPRGTSFDVGQLTAEDRAKVPLALVRPILLRPSLLNRDEDEDDLKLSVLLRQRLVASSQPAGRGKDAAIVYVPEDEFPGAVRPTGTYTVDGNNVSVRITLRRDGAILARLQVEGTKSEVAVLADKMAAAILEATK